MASTTTTTAATALRRQSMNAVATEREAEEQEGFYQLRKHRFHAYKMGFFAMVFALQSGDAISDVATEGFYFFSDEGGSGNTELLKMSQLFDFFYAAHGIVSLIVSAFILQKIFLVFHHMRNKTRRRKEQAAGNGASPFSEDSPEAKEKPPPHGSAHKLYSTKAQLRRAAERLRQDDANNPTGSQNQRADTQGGGGVSSRVSRASLPAIIRRALRQREVLPPPRTHALSLATHAHHATTG